MEDGKDVPSELRSLCHGPILVLSNGMDRSCVATIYPVLDKPRTTGASQRQEKDQGSSKPALMFRLSGNTQQGWSWIA